MYEHVILGELGWQLQDKYCEIIYCFALSQALCTSILSIPDLPKLSFISPFQFLLIFLPYAWAFTFLQISAILLPLLCLCSCLYYTLPSTSAYENSTSSLNHKCIFQYVLSDISLLISL